MTPAPLDTRIAGSKVKGLNCPGCGAAMNVRGFEHTVTVVCPQCLSILDARDPNLKILQKFQDKTRVTLRIPLGSRGSWRGTQYEAIGFQRRTVQVDGVDYSWFEYLLFNPYKGFRYFTEYNGHWNFVRTLRALPKPGRTVPVRPHVQYDGIDYRDFSAAQAKTTYVLGEFPWQARRGESVLAKDYIAPPKILSSEMTPSETTWSIGEYVSGEEIWRAFKLPGSAPKPVGIYLNQPSPLIEKSRNIWRLCGTFLLIALAMLLAGHVLARNEEAYSGRFRFAAGAQTDTSFVTPVFDLKGGTSNVEIRTSSDLANNWAYLNYALINEETGQAYDFGRELSYYYGSDSDGNWSEGSSSDTVTVPAIPGGRYYLRVEPETPPGLQKMDYSIRVRRDVPSSGYFWIVSFLLLIPPALVTFRRFSFESQRWRESDYAPASSSGDDD